MKSGSRVRCPCSAETFSAVRCLPHTEAANVELIIDSEHDRHDYPPIHTTPEQPAKMVRRPSILTPKRSVLAMRKRWTCERTGNCERRDGRRKSGRRKALLQELQQHIVLLNADSFEEDGMTDTGCRVEKCWKSLKDVRMEIGNHTLGHNRLELNAYDCKLGTC